MRNRLALITAMMALPLASAAAQNAAPRNVISLQPLSAMMTVYSGEFERAVGKSVSWGVGATYWDAGENNNTLQYTSGDVKLRYYPGGTALHGFAFGGSVGYSNIESTVGTTNETASGASIGVSLEYQWLMGASRNFSVALGAGAKALMVDEKNVTNASFTARYPTARVSVGYAF